MARGSLRIYLGAAPGVGKTYAMLNEGRRRRERGEDVVVGLVETHGRRPTAEQVGDLEVIPRKPVEYRGTTLEELDVDAVLARRPDIVLVDELAHTNAPGSRNEKRWQDIDQLLEAGIGVISTVNIQHLESLNDVVEQITGMRQQETVPDEVVRRADQLQLVDLASESIRARLARGDIYPAERIDVALANYFRPGNLTALRELALLWVADRVDEGLREYRERHGIERPWETKERVIVALTGAPGGDRVIRRAARMAQRANGELVAVHVRPQDGLAAATPEELSRQRELVEELGGEYREAVGADIGQTLVETARSLNATQVVLGATRRSRLGQLFRGSVINRVIADSGVGIDVHVISHPSEVDAEFVLPRRRRPAALSRRRVVLGFIAAAVALPLLTAVLAGLRDELGLPSVLLLFLLLVVGVSALGGLWPALASRRRRLPDRQLVLHAAALHVHDRRDRERPGAVRLPCRRCRREPARLARGSPGSGRRASTGGGAGARPSCRLVDGSGGARCAGPDALGFRARPCSIAQEDGWLIEGAAGLRAPENPDAAGFTLRLDDAHVLTVADADPGPDEVRILEAFGRELAASLELEELQAEASTAASLASAGELRSAILSAVSHDLRTPIAAIKASVSSLLQDDVSWTEEARREFLDTIDEEVDRLNGLVGNLLDMSRLQAGAVEVRREPVGLDEVVPAALRSLGGTADGIDVDVPESLPRVLADAGLLERALANIVGNAVRHSPEGRRVRLARRARGWRRRHPCRRLWRGGRGGPPGGDVPAVSAARRLRRRRRRRSWARGRKGLRGGDGRRHRGRGDAGRRPDDDRPAGGCRMTRILVVDDEPQILRALATNLRARDYDVDLAATGEEALTIAARKHPDLVIVDLGLPTIDGVEVIRGLRGWTEVPIIVLSVREGEGDKVDALDAGADDYVTKPFGMDELLARMRAALRRAVPGEEEAVVETGHFRADLAAKRVERDGEEIRLTPTEWQIVETLVRHPGRLITQRQLLQSVWGPQYEKETNYLRVYLAQIRRKLEPDPAKPRYFVTEPGMGYRFEP